MTGDKIKSLDTDRIGALRGLALLGAASLFGMMLATREIHTYEDALSHPEIRLLAGKVSRFGAKVRAVYYQLQALTEELDTARRNPDYSLDDVADLFARVDALETPYQEVAQPFMVAWQEFSAKMQEVLRAAAEKQQVKTEGAP